MRVVQLPVVGTVAAWRAAVRGLAAAGVPPERVVWSCGGEAADLFAGEGAAASEADQPPASRAPRLSIPKVASEAIDHAVMHRDRDAFGLAHRTVVRLAGGDVAWGDRSDPDMRRILLFAANVRRDIHKMHAFVRFREVPGDSARRRFAAWFEPSHRIAEAAAPFFANRFGDMDWVIATPDVTLRFVGGTLGAEPAAGRPPPVADGTEALWRTYYTSIFNPARLNARQMQSEMPRKYWKNLPEADVIPDLVRSAAGRVEGMTARAPSTISARPRGRTAEAIAANASEGLPATLSTAGEAASRCTRCALHACATQTVWGEGPPDARLMILGEAPGDQEDLSGRPFVGPAGQLLDRVLADAGVPRTAVYLTNAVKHFSFRVRGKRRLHQRPNAGEIDACRWWLDLERRLVRPRVVLGLGATAAIALTGRGEGLLARRGGVEALSDGSTFIPSLHPSYLLRLREPASRAEAQGFLRDDLARAWELAAGGA